MASETLTTGGRASARPMDMQKHVPPSASRSLRKHPVHLSPGEKHNRAIIIYVTTCTAKRRSILASPGFYEAIIGAWREASTWLVGRYVVMPDHIHFLSAPNGLDVPPLKRWMRYWKSIVTKRIVAKGGNVWQRDHWDRQLRSVEKYDQKWEYVRRNPVRHGYCDDPDDWPYHGELNVLPW